MPVLVQAGLCLHGTRAVETHCQRGLWSLHAYHYAGRLTVAGSSRAFQPGWLSLIPPGLNAEWQFPQHAPHYYAHFKAEKAPGAKPTLLLRDLGKRSASFGALMDEMIGFSPRQSTRANVRLWDLLFQLAEETDWEGPPARLHPHLQIALSLIRNNPSGKLLVGHMARQMGVCGNHLTQLFNDQFGCGVREYIQRERINRACELLRETRLQVKSIAIECGFPDLQYFNKVIRRATGYSPTGLRLQDKAGAAVGK